MAPAEPDLVPATITQDDGLDDDNDPGSVGLSDLPFDSGHGYAPGHARRSLQVQHSFDRNPHGGDLYVFRDCKGDFIKGL
ncbi:MAG: hypothetical protein AAGA21_23110 [Pseudomonadota bacterium]